MTIGAVERFEALKKYSGIFGEPREGVHAARIPVLDVALVDVLATAAAAVALAAAASRLYGKSFSAAFIAAFLLLLVAGVLVHRLFSVDTRVNVLVFGRSEPGARTAGAR